MSKMNLTQSQFKTARSVGVPLLAIETPDQAATIAMLSNNLDAPIFQWDLIRGINGVNQRGIEELTSMEGDLESFAMKTGNPAEALDWSRQLPQTGILFLINAHRILGSEAPSQAIWNLRDLYKMNQRTLILLGPAFSFPPELSRDVIVLSEDLPSDELRKELVMSLFSDAGLDLPDDMTMGKIVEATRGLATFPTEQVTAMSMSREGVNLAELWEHKKKMIETSKGLQLLRVKETFKDIGGIESAKNFGTKIFSGNAAPSSVVFIDEIEKMLSGATGGDLSGVSQDFLGVILNSMEENNWTGLIAVGPPGCAKSFYAKALGASHNVPTIQMDLGALKGSLVGQSETQMRECIKTIKAVSGSGAFFVATCNKLDSLPPELRRRFRLGIWFFDLPDQQERTSIWKLNKLKYKIDDKQSEPHSTGWTGADIRNCCEVAWRLNVPLTDAAKFITPVSQSDPESITKLRNLANNRFLSASYPGTYQLPKEGSKGEAKRKLAI